MASVFRVLLPPLGGWLLTIVALTPLPVMAADRVAMRIEVFGPAGLHIATNHTAIDESGNQYAIIGDVATRGLAGFFSDLKSHSEVRGHLTAMTAEPEAFQSDIRSNGADRRDRVNYRAGGTASGSSAPPAGEPGAAAARGTIDPLTAYFLIERQLARGGDCALAVPVFDGRNRYTLRFSAAGQQQVLSPTAGQRFSGAATPCQMTRQDIAGASDPDQSDSARQGTIWYARLVPGDLMIPVRMQMTTDIATLDGYLAELHGRGVDLPLME